MLFFSLLASLIFLFQLSSRMRKFYFPVFITLLLCSCDSTPTRTETNSAPDSTLVRPAPLTEYSAKFRQILKNEEGTVRGVQLGDQLDRVIVREDTVPTEDSTSYVSFTEELGNEEFTDVLYYFDEDRQIRSITLDTYLLTQSAVDSLETEFSRYFTERYGKPVTREAKTIGWQGGDSIQVLMKDVGVKEAPGLQVQIQKQ